MTTSAKCHAKDPSSCRYHGGLAYAKKKEEVARLKLNRAYQVALKGKGKTDDARQRLGKARREFEKAQAYSDSFESEYEVLIESFSTFPEDTPNNPSMRDTNEFRSYSDRVARATEARIQKFNDASDPLLPVISGFPDNREEAAYVLKRNNCGAFIGVRKTGQQKDEKDTYQVVGTKGYYEVQSDGYLSAVGTLHSLDEESTPTSLKETALAQGGNDLIGYRTLYSHDGDVATVDGYDIYTKTHYINTDANGLVRKTSTMTTV